MFVHIGFIHLLYNLIAFTYVGPTVEKMIGNTGFLVLYVVAGLGGSLWALYLNPMLVHAGASGAIFGIYGALLAILLRQRGSIPADVSASLKKLVLVFVAYNMLNSLRPGISLAAHFGGLVIGFGCGLAVGQPLSPAAIEGRPLRNLVAAAVGLVVVVAGVLATQGKYPGLSHLQDTLNHFDAIEAQSHKTFAQAADQARQHQITGVQFADLIEHDVLPEWRSTENQVAALSAIPSSTVAKVEKYMHLRQESLEGLAASLRAGKDDDMKDAAEKQAKADKMSSWASTQ